MNRFAITSLMSLIALWTFSVSKTDAQGSLIEAYTVQAKKSYDKGDYDAAYRLLSKAVQSLSRDGHMLETLDTATVLNNFGEVCIKKGLLDEAENALQNSIRIKESLLGTKSVHVISGLENLATVYIQRNETDRFPEAEALLNRAIEIRLWKEGKNTTNVANDYFLLGDLNENSNPQKAYEYYEKARKLWTMKFGAFDALIGKCFHHMAHLKAMNRKNAEAVAFYDKALGIYNKHLPATKNNIEELKRMMHEILTSEYDKSINSLLDAQEKYGKNNKDVRLRPYFRQAAAASSRVGKKAEAEFFNKYYRASMKRTGAKKT